MALEPWAETVEEEENGVLGILKKCFAERTALVERDLSVVVLDLAPVNFAAGWLASSPDTGAVEGWSKVGEVALPDAGVVAFSERVLGGE